MEQIQQIRNELLAELQTLENPNDILKSPKIKELYKIIPTLPNEQKGAFGAQVNDLKNEIQAEAAKIMEAKESAEVEALDISAPFAESSPEKIVAKPELLSAKNGSIHPLQKELERVVDIYTRMGFEAVESRQIDDDWNMFGALNFPENHPARDGYDTFRTEEGFIPPAHTSTMQNRVLKHGKKQLEEEGQIAHVLRRNAVDEAVVSFLLILAGHVVRPPAVEREGWVGDDAIIEDQVTVSIEKARIADGVTLLDPGVA